MTGIISYAGYLPRFRLDRMTVFSAMGWLNPATIMNAAGEKAVANNDEDSLTMAVSASLQCLQGFDRDRIGALYFASTTAPFRERQNANLVAGALGLSERIRTADFGGSLKAGTTGLLSALDYAASAEGQNALACSADCRLGRAGSVQEMIFGDGGAAFAVGSKEIIAAYRGSHSLSCDFVDHMRGANSRYDRQWEERWIRDLGYGRLIPQVFEETCDKFKLKAGDFNKIIYPCPYGAARKSINRKLGLKPEQVQDDLVMEAGLTGAAHPLLMLAAALETAGAGDQLLVIGYGNGCDAIWFTVTDSIENYQNRKRVTASLENKIELNSYLKYLAWRDLLPVETGMRGEEERLTRLSLLWRNRRAFLSLEGTRCRECGTRQYPPQRVCINPECGAVDKMDPVAMGERGGRITSFTADMLAATTNPPAIYGNIDFKGGGRCMMDFTDCTMEDLQVGGEVDFSFRIKYYDQKRDTTFYFWKAVPTREVP